MGQKNRDFIGKDDLFIGKNAVDHRQHQSQLHALKYRGQKDKSNGGRKPFDMVLEEPQEFKIIL